MRLARRLLLIGAALLSVLLLVGAGSCSSSTNENHLGSSQVAHKLHQISLGMSEDEVRSILGGPNDTETTNTEGYKSDCWWYGNPEDWRFCFDNGLLTHTHHAMRLTSINHYLRYSSSYSR